MLNKKSQRPQIIQLLDLVDFKMLCYANELTAAEIKVIFELKTKLMILMHTQCTSEGSYSFSKTTVESENIGRY